jgi:PLP dependent protein
MSAITTNLQAIRLRIANAAIAVGRPVEDIQLLAVSKTKPLSDIQAAVAAGQHAFGENYVQEGCEKSIATIAQHLEWHFIGPLQSNKTRLVAENFAWVHSIERLRIAERLSAQRPINLPPLQVCIQVNLSGEASKSGCMPAEALALCQAIVSLPRLRLRGLMAIPAASDDPKTQRQSFRQLRDLFETIRSTGLPLDTLSMGMTHDLESAIAEGATIIRVGAGIFGERNHA